MSDQLTEMVLADLTREITDKQARRWAKKRLRTEPWVLWYLAELRKLGPGYVFTPFEEAA